MALYTELAPPDLAEVARAYALADPLTVRPEPKGGVNSNYHLWAGGDRFFLRLNEGKSDADVRFEAEVQRFLFDAQFPVARLVVAVDGRPFVTVAGRQAMLFAYAPGEELALPAVTPDHCRRVGEQLGRLHELSRGLTAERPNPYDRPRVRAWLDALEPDGAGDAEVREALPLLREELARADALPGAPRGLVHGDLFVDNVLWIGDRIGALLDWEMSGLDAFAYDLAVALNAWCFVDRYEPARAVALLAGYRSRARLEPETRAALPAFARWAALRFTASRIHGYHLARLDPSRLARKDWRRYRDRLLALRALGDAGLLALVGMAE